MSSLFHGIGIELCRRIGMSWNRVILQMSSLFQGIGTEGCSSFNEGGGKLVIMKVYYFCTKGPFSSSWVLLQWPLATKVHTTYNHALYKWSVISVNLNLKWLQGSSFHVYCQVVH